MHLILLANTAQIHLFFVLANTAVGLPLSLFPFFLLKGRSDF